ncbi:MAG: hypothetical protein AB7G28_07900 [Pirellulales bacterium]
MDRYEKALREERRLQKEAEKAVKDFDAFKGYLIESVFSKKVKVVGPTYLRTEKSKLNHLHRLRNKAKTLLKEYANACDASEAAEKYADPERQRKREEKEREHKQFLDKVYAINV